LKSTPLILILPSTQRRGAELDDASISLSNRYSNAVIAGGGLPWIMPCATDPNLVEEMVRRADGVLLTGGEDVQPDLYKPRLEPTLRKKVSPPERERDLSELLVIDAVFRQKKPLFAICRGLQMLNVALGGTLLADIRTQRPRAMKHDRFDQKYKQVHSISVAADSQLASVCGRTELAVNSTHHQAVDRVADPLRVTAVSADGVIEAAELKPEASRWLPFMMAVQFHPERLFDRHREFLELFKNFVRVSAARIK
jgi:putative glutamine amidotransferase